VRNTPVITIVDPPDLPVKPVPQGVIVNGIISLVLGTLLSIALAFGREFMRELQTQ